MQQSVLGALVIVLLVASGACTRGAKGSMTQLSSSAMRAERAAITQADVDFERATAHRGVEGWVSYFAPNGSQGHEDGSVSTGHEAIRKAMEPVFSNPARRLTWRPLQSHMVAPDLGVTIGRWESLRTEADGRQTVVARGSYVTVWRKQPDGQWKVAYDTGSADPPTASR